MRLVQLLEAMPTTVNMAGEGARPDHAAALLDGLATTLATTLATRRHGLLAASHIKFRKPVLPGDTVSFYVKQTRELGRLCRLKARAEVNAQCVADGHLDLARQPPPQ